MNISSMKLSKTEVLRMFIISAEIKKALKNPRGTRY